MRIDVNVEGSFFDMVSFTTSTTYKEVDQETRTFRNAFVENVAFCTQYKASLKNKYKVSCGTWYFCSFN